MIEFLARLLLALLQPVSVALARWRFASLDRTHRRLVARLLTRRRYSRLVEIYAMPTPQQQLANYVQTTLAGGPYTNASTVFTLTSVAGLPTIGNFMLRIDDVAPATTFEYIEIASVNVGAGTVTTSTNGPSSNGRGMEGTTAIAHNAGAFIGNAITAAMLLRSFAWGMLSGGYAQVAVNQGGITAQVDLTGLTVSVTAGTGRRLKITGYVTGVISTVAGDTATLVILENTTTLGSMQTGALLVGNGQGVRAEAIVTPAAGSHTYKLSALRSGGTGSELFGAPMSILVEDIGPA